MKWFSIITAAFMASLTLAAPTPSAKTDQMDIYNLRITCASNPDLDGRILSSQNDAIGVYPGASALELYPAKSTTAGLWQLHTYPTGTVESVVGLVGPNTAASLKQISSPNSAVYPDGTRADWSSWAMNASSHDSRRRLTYASSRGGSWAAFPRAAGGWGITWLEPNAMTTQDYMPIEIIFEKPINNGA